MRTLPLDTCALLWRIWREPVRGGLVTRDARLLAYAAQGHLEVLAC